MLKLNVTDETSRLRAVVLGVARNNGPIPKLEDAYDPKSKEHIQKGSYPLETDMVKEIQEVEAVLDKYEVKIFRPHIIPNYNQLFSRDIGFVIEDKFIKANILPDRAREIDAIAHVLEMIEPSKIIELPENAHVEGGDVMPMGDYIFVGTYRGNDYSNYITARTNKEAVIALQDLFPHKKVKSFNLRKSNTNARENALHLDCCYQPVGENLAIIHKNGFLEETEYKWLVDFHGEKNVFEITANEMYEMYSNIFSISKKVVISDKSFIRLNDWLQLKGITVETVNYREIAKQEGLLRCSTLPLIRDK